MNAEVLKYILFIIRRFWIVLLIAAILGGAAYWFFDSQEPVYRAETRVFIGGSALLANPSVNAISEGLRLAPTYAQLVELDPILQPTIDELDLEMSTRALARMVSTRVIIDTSILVIRVDGSNPQRITDIANEITRQLIANSPSNLSGDEVEQMAILQEQINQLRSNIAVINEQAIDLLAELNTAIDDNNTRRVEVLTDQYNQATDRLTTARAALATTSETYSSFSNRLNRLQVIEQARVPVSSSNRNPLLVGLIAAAAGAGAGIAALLIYFEYVDQKLRTEKEINKTLELPVIGIIKRSFRVGMAFNGGKRTPGLLRMSIAEGYRTIQTNLLFSPLGNSTGKIFLIASPKSNEGRSFTAANLATTVADSGLKVLLIDADMRQPRLHRIFGLPNDRGLLSISQQKDIISNIHELMRTHVQRTELPTLDVITSGIGGDNKAVLPAQVFGSDGLKQFVKFLREDETYDVILIDTSGALEVADSYMLTAATNANIVLLIRAAQTTQEQAVKARDQFEHIGGNIRGVILNRA